MCGWKGRSVLEADDPDTPVQWNMECSNCGSMSLMFVEEEELADFLPPTEPDFDVDWESELAEFEGWDTSAKPDGDDEGAFDDE